MTDAFNGAGVYEMDENTYFTDPVPGGSLSHSGAKQILDCPARFHHANTTGHKTHKDAFDFGTAAHAAVLGVGNIAVLDFPDRRTKAYKEAEAEARAAGQTPVMVKDWATVEAMADKLREHPLASKLLDPDTGQPERSLFWEADDIWKRARLDWLPNPDNGPRDSTGALIVVDYKTTPEGGASINAFEKAIVNFGYHTQAAHYGEGVAHLLGEVPSFLFIAQEKVEPYLVNVVQLSSELLAIGEQRMEHAVATYKACKASGVWPGYSDGVELATCPTWAAYEHSDNCAKWGIAA